MHDPIDPRGLRVEAKVAAERERILEDLVLDAVRVLALEEAPAPRRHVARTVNGLDRDLVRAFGNLVSAPIEHPVRAQRATARASLIPTADHPPIENDLDTTNARLAGATLTVSCASTCNE
jgi:hypothetical protein